MASESCNSEDPSFFRNLTALIIVVITGKRYQEVMFCNYWLFVVTVCYGCCL